MTSLILAIGAELLNGEMQETNSTFLERQLSLYSLEVKKVSILPDDVDLICSEIQQALKEYSYIFIMGGLGPTEDDLTRTAVARALKRELIQDNREMEILKAKFEVFKKRMSPNNEKQTFFPERSVVLPNPIGTASGFTLKEKNTRLFVLPGVPSEMKIIFQNTIVSILDQEVPKLKKPGKLVVKTIGKGESVLDALVKEKIIPHHPARWEIIAKGEGVFIKFYPVDGEGDETWDKGLRQSLGEHLGSCIYGYGDDDMGETIAGLLLKKKLTLACVESCTGGYVSKYLTDRPGSSEYFLGGIVSYSNDLKIRLANVDPELLRRFGAVSKEVAESMVMGGARALGSDLCLSITGIAGPAGGSREKPVGTVWFGVKDHFGRVFSHKGIFNGDRNDIRKKSVFHGLNYIRLALLESSG